MGKRILLYVLSVLAGVVFSVLFHLQWEGRLILCLVCIGLVPFFERAQKHAQKAAAEFQDVTLYMEQVLCSYRRWGKLKNAWEDCLLLFERESRMGLAITAALQSLGTGGDTDVENIGWTACRCIHKEYPYERVILLHEFLCRAERTGGDTGEALSILLNDLQLWKRRKSLFQTRKKILKTESVLAFFLGCCLCGFSAFIMPTDLEEQISSAWYQIFSTAVICLLMITMAAAFHNLSFDWSESCNKSDRNIREQKKKYALLKSRSRGIKWHMAKKYCRGLVENVFSYWLLSVTLYLQHGTVYQALMDSLGQLHGMFREEVTLLIHNIYENPTSFQPYIGFFEELEMEEIRTGMKLLYAAGNNEYQDVSREIHVLVEQNHVIMDKFERNRQDMQTAGLGFWKQAPMILASFKIIMDMAVMLVLTMERYAVF